MNMSEGMFTPAMRKASPELPQGPCSMIQPCPLTDKASGLCTTHDSGCPMVAQILYDLAHRLRAKWL